MPPLRRPDAGQAAPHTSSNAPRTEKPGPEASPDDHTPTYTARQRPRRRNPTPAPRAHAYRAHRLSTSPNRWPTPPRSPSISDTRDTGVQMRSIPTGDVHDGMFPTGPALSYRRPRFRTGPVWVRSRDPTHVPTIGHTHHPQHSRVIAVERDNPDVSGGLAVPYRPPTCPPDGRQE